MPTSVITAIRVQDIAAQQWFNWDDGVWDSAGQPVVTAGAKNLYIAAYVVQVEYGVVGLAITDDTGAYLVTKSEMNPPGGVMGVEASDLTMPNRDYNITVLTTGAGVTFTIKTPLEEKKGKRQPIKGLFGLWPFPIINMLLDLYGP